MGCCLSRRARAPSYVCTEAPVSTRDTTIGYASGRSLLLNLWLLSLGSKLNPRGEKSYMKVEDGRSSLRHWTDEDDLRASCAPRWSISKDGEFYEKKNFVELWQVSLLGRVAIGSSSLAILFSRYVLLSSFHSFPLRKTEPLEGWPHWATIVVSVLGAGSKLILHGVPTFCQLNQQPDAHAAHLSTWASLVAHSIVLSASLPSFRPYSSQHFVFELLSCLKNHRHY